MTPRLTGRPTLYRGKVAQPVTMKFTPEGHAALAHGMRALGLNASEYVEKLLREARARAEAASETRR